MKNILDIVSYQYLPYTSGGQKSIALFLEYLGNQANLHVVSTTTNQINLAKHYTLHPILGTTSLRYANIFTVFRLLKIIRQQQIDTLLIEHPYIGWMGILLKWITGVKLILHTHNIEYERFRSLGKPWWKLLKGYESIVLKYADTIFCISDEDKNWMITKMGINSNKCVTIPYGIIQNKTPEDKQLCKEKVCHLHNLDPTVKLLFFNGLLSYPPNADALRDIIKNIAPLLQEKGLKYNILIAGKGLPDEFEGIMKYHSLNVYYAGFVDDINLYTKAADIFLNPVNTGGGVKTKMIEALGMNTVVISTINGALGVDKKLCGDNLYIVENEDWNGFAAAVMNSLNTVSNIPTTFYEIYHWGAIVNKCINFL